MCLKYLKTFSFVLIWFMNLSFFQAIFVLPHLKNIKYHGFCEGYDWYKGAMYNCSLLSLVFTRKMRRTTIGILLFVVMSQLTVVIQGKYLWSSFSVEDQPFKRWRQIPQQSPLVSTPVFSPAIGTSFFLCSSGYKQGASGTWSKKCVEKLKRMTQIHFG